MHAISTAFVSRVRLRVGSRALLVRMMAVGLIVALLPFPAYGAEPHEGEVIEHDPELREEQSWTGLNMGMALWFWPEGNRAYQLSTVSGRHGRLEVLKAYDSRTMAEVASARLMPAAWGIGPHTNEFHSGGGRHHTAAVDREHGRMFVAYATSVVVTPQDMILHGYNPADETPCTATGAWNAGCASGVHVLDGESLESLGKIRLELPGLEGPRFEPIVRALEYVPGDEARGWGGRVLMIVEEAALSPLESSPAPALSSTVQYATPRRNGSNIAYAVAFDPDTMRQEWAVRLDACRSAREPRNWFFSRVGHPAAILRDTGADPAVYIGCHGNAAQQGVVVRVPLDEDGIAATLPVRLGDPVAEADPNEHDLGLSDAMTVADRQEVFPGPEKVISILADPASRRILMKVDDSGEVWWVFDGQADQFIGTIGIGPYRYDQAAYGLDQDTGRLYVQAPDALYMADIRRNPLPQALVFPEFGSADLRSAGAANQEMSVQPRASNGLTRLFITENDEDGKAFMVLSDKSAVSVDPEPEAQPARSLDINESAGVTEATFDGTARGFGFRTILVGGIEGAARVGPADPLGLVRGARQWEETGTPGQQQQVTDPIEALIDRLPEPDPCSNAQRELVVAFVGPEAPATVDATGARGSAQPVLADVRTREDLEQPVTRCAPMGWQELWRTALVSQPPIDEPGVAWPFEDGRSSCTATDEREEDSWNDPVVGMFASRVECSENQVGGWGQARGANLDDVSVANTLSSFRIYRDPDRGLVARVESIARGVDIGGIVKIDTIRGVAESWANGRHAPFVDDELERELGLTGADGEGGSDAPSEPAAEEDLNPYNCDSARPAGTCFQRHILGVTVVEPVTGEVAYRCGPCGDEEALIEAMNRAFGAYGHARFRQPDPVLARGSADGYIAAITKKDKERFADIVMNADLLETIVPMLEFVRYAPHNRPTSRGLPDFSTGVPPRGRQVYQFAAVEVSSTYGIQCLLEYDPESNVCAPPVDEPASLSVELVDVDGQPLGGGAFEVHADSDGDGILGLADELVSEGACVTADDGVGSCRFEGLVPGSYLVSQVAAPPGYSAAAEPFAVSLSAGVTQTVTFTNTSSVSLIDLTVTDPDGAALAGASFGVFPDAGDGTIAVDAAPVATCTTDEMGACMVEVEPGAYVLRQLEAPAGFTPIADIAFAITSGGQTASVDLVLAAAGGDTQPVAHDGVQTQPVASPVMHFDPGPSASSATASSQSTANRGAGIDLPRVAQQVGDTIVRVIRAPAAVMRLASRSPIEAASFAAVWALLALAALAVRRRVTLAALVAAPAGFGPAWHPPASRPSPPGRPAGRGEPMAFNASSPTGGTAVLERRPAGLVAGGTPTEHAVIPYPPVAGAAPSPTEGKVVVVAVATAFPALAALLTQKLASDDRCQLVEAVDSLEQLRAVLIETQPDVLVIDLALPVDDQEDGKDLCSLLPDLYPPQRIVGIIPPNRPTETLVRGGAFAGIAGLLVADEDLGNGHLAYAVHSVAAGKPCYGPTVQALLLGGRPGEPLAIKKVRKPGQGALTPREREVARLAANGASRTDIAKQLYLSPSTVKRHLHSIRAKLGVTNPWDRSQFRQRVEERGLLDDSGPNDL